MVAPLGGGGGSLRERVLELVVRAHEAVVDQDYNLALAILDRLEEILLNEEGSS